jgi:MGT family glycosyltransferase
MTRVDGRHITIVAPPLPGHWDPLQVLAGLLVDRGHRVTFLHIGDSAAMLKDSAFGFEPVGTGSHGPGALAAYRDRLAHAPSLRGFLPMLRATAAMSEMLLRDLPSALQRIGAEAVIGDETEPAAGMVARYLGLPWITSVTGLPLLRDPLVPPPFVGWRFRDDPGGLKRNQGGYRVADRLMRPIRRVLEERARAWGLDLEEIDAGSPLLQVAQCPPTLDFPRRELPASFRYCGPFRSGDAAAVELPRDRPLVYCSLGSLQGNRPQLFGAMTSACAGLGARAIVGHGGLLSDAAARALPGDPLVAPYWPQPAILPQCSAALLHGGFNTVLDTLAAGVPMAVRPLAFEQPGTAARVVRSGAGIMVGRNLLGRRNMRAALRSLLQDPTFGEAADAMARGMAKLGGARLAADLVDEALRTGRLPPAPA